MMKVKGIFAVSFIAMMVVGGAYANIASSGYVDEKINGLATVAKTGAYGDLSGRPTIPTVNDATLTIQKNGATVDTFTANASANKTINITVPTTTNQLTNNSGFITAANLPVATANALGGVKSSGDITVATSGAVTVNSATRADSATTAASATKATQDASGNVITSTYATKSELTSGLSGKQATLTSAQLNAVNSGITSTKVSTYDGYSAKITAAQSAASAAQTAANGKVTANAAITAGTATKITYDAKGLVTGGASLTASDIPTIPSTKVSGLGTLATKSAVTSAEITDGTITNADIAANAAIATSKISGLSTVATSGSYDDLKDKPTIPTVNNATLTIQKNGTNVATFTANSASAATANITVPTKTSELTNDSSFATTTQVNARVATAQGTDNANDVMVVNSSGNVAPALITNANISSSAAIAQSKISGLTDALAGKLSTTGTAAKATADANGNNIASTYATKSQITALDSTLSGTGAVVTGVSQTDGKVSVTKGNVKIPFGGRDATDYAAIWVE